MSEQQDNSSLSILLTIAAAVLVTVGAGWFLLDDEFSLGTATPEAPLESVDPGAARESVEATDSTATVVQQQPQDESGEVPAETAESDQPAASLEADLRKARLAAEADILAYPPEQSALYYYNRVLEADAQHELARAELDAVLGRIAQIVTGHMVAEEYFEAYDLAVLVARRNPDHALVREVQQGLDRLTNVYVERAIQHAQDGDDDGAADALRAAEALPGRNPEYFSAVIESIANIRDARLAAEQSRIERSRLAAVQATAAWVTKVRSAIQTGRLIAPAGESAVDYLAEDGAPEDEKAQLKDELVGALKAECSARLNAGNLTGAERFLTATMEIAGESTDLVALRNSLEDAYIAAESNKVVTLDDFVRLNTSPARYPRRAQDRGLEGWVEVLFTVTPSGETTNIEVQQAEPEEVFNESAIEAVGKWTFEPRVYRGRIISQRAGARLVFRLE